MPVNRDHWCETIGPNHNAAWHCPSCNGGYVKVKPSSFYFGETAESIKDRKSPAFEADWVKYKFTCLLVCNNTECQEILTVAGAGTIIEFTGDDFSESHYGDVFFPAYINPSPNLIKIPTNCPDEVTNFLKKAFVQSWGDQRGAANSIRTAVESLLDFLKIPKQQLNKHKRVVRIKLHERILNLQKRDPTLHDALLALKHIGNAGSHRSAVTRWDVYDMLDIIETVLEHCFNDNKALRRTIKLINQRKGPLSKTKAAF